MGDLDKASKRFTEYLAFKLLIERGYLPCPWGGGDCIISSLGKRDGEENGPTYHLLGCSKARSVQDGQFGAFRRKRELREQGCPRHKHSFFSGWNCKYADGNWYLI